MLNQFGLVETQSVSVKVGDLFGRLTIVAVGQVAHTYRYYAICQCSCGSPLKRVRMDGLASGMVTSCGCVQKERITKHGLSKSTHYSRWRLMIDRCENVNSQSYPDYGGRGITVCERWHDIKNFVSDLPPGYFDGAEMDRIDNDGDYEPGNIRWATRSENCDNRRSGRLLTHDGRTQSLRRWAEELGVDDSVIQERLSVWGWSVARSVTTPAVSAAERMATARSARWAGHVKAPRPAPRVLRRIDYDGKSWLIADLAAHVGVSKKLLAKRIFERGWPVDRAVKQTEAQ